MKEDWRKKPLYTISTVAKLLNVHPQTLRLYEREGLIKPQRSPGNTRLYTEEDIERLRVIFNLTRELGVNLAGVDVILRLRERIERMEQEVEGLLRFIRDELSREYKDVEEKFNNALVRSPYRGIIKLERVEHRTAPMTPGATGDSGDGQETKKQPTPDS